MLPIKDCNFIVFSFEFSCICAQFCSGSSGCNDEISNSIYCLQFISEPDNDFNKYCLKSLPVCQCHCFYLQILSLDGYDPETMWTT